MDSSRPEHGTRYGTLYTWGDQPRGWDSEDMPSSFYVAKYFTDGIPNGWTILCDPAIKGKVTVLNDPIKAHHTIEQDVTAWPDYRTPANDGGLRKQGAAHEFINSMITLSWQVRPATTTGSTATPSYDQAVDEGLTSGELKPTLIPRTREERSILREEGLLPVGRGHRRAAQGLE